MRGLAFALFTVLLILAWPFLQHHVPGLLPPGFALADRADPLPALPLDADLDRHLHQAGEYALAFWWMVCAVAFLILEPGRIARIVAAARGETGAQTDRDALAQAAAVSGAVGRGLGAIGAAAAGSLADAAARNVAAPAAAVGAIAGGFGAWLAHRLPWFVKRGLIGGVIALLIAGSASRFVFGLLVMVLVMPMWMLLLDLSIAIMVGVAGWALFTRGFEALLRLGTVTRCDLWTNTCADIDVRPFAVLIWCVLMLGCLVRAWLDYRRLGGERMPDGALQRARERVAARRRAAGR
jgi:hypothetical protein